MRNQGMMELFPKLQDAARTLEKSIPTLIEYQKMFAKIQRARYLALVEEGFTEAQALELCRGVGG